jgi:hypothetical protein
MLVCGIWIYHTTAPFAMRVQGHTVNDWLDIYTDDNWMGPDYSVMQEFGTNALPILIREHKGSLRLRLHKITYPIEKLTGMHIWNRFSHVERKPVAAWEWGALWASQPGELENLLKHNQDDRFVYDVFYLTADHLTGYNWLETYTTNADSEISSRAQRLLKRYNERDR